MNATLPTSLDWADIFNQYQERISKYIYRRTSDPELAEDLASEVFIKAIEAEGKGIGSQSHFTGWLYRIAHNAVIDYYRARNLVLGGVELDAMYDEGDSDRGRARVEVLASDLPTPHEQAERALDNEQIYQAIERLTDEQRWVVLRRMEGYEFEEIAAEMGKGLSAVKGLQQRSYVRLYTQLRGYVGVTGERDAVRKTYVDKICTVLQECGPLTKNQIAKKLGIKNTLVHSAISFYRERFTVIGSIVNKRGKVMYVWGLVGIHDTKKESA